MLGRNTGKRKLHEVPEHRRVSPGAGAKALAAMRMAAAAAEDDASSEQQARRSAEYIQQARRFERLSGERSRTSSDFAAGFLPSGSMAARALSEIRRPPAMPADVLSTSLLARAMFSTNGQQASTSGNKMAHYEMLQGRIGSALESLLEHHWQNKDRIATDPPPDDVLKRVNCLRPPSSNCIIPGLHAEEVRGLHGGPELLSLLMHHRDGSPSSGDSSRRVSLGTIPEHADAIRSSNDSGSRNPRSSLGQRPEPLMLPSEV
ncbi:hypothetical protein WJX72_005183 [[Myrmecia] bisecta]|uniref:Uncharacterized protein n=1 Tax=[Myrmecia] bisecta TaxID=41462 RepID=A0AAW1P734_9CHLO